MLCILDDAQKVLDTALPCLFYFQALYSRVKVGILSPNGFGRLCEPFCRKKVVKRSKRKRDEKKNMLCSGSHTHLWRQLRITELPPDLLYWNFLVLRLFWYFFNLTQERPATSKEHQMVIRAVRNRMLLQATRPTKQKLSTWNWQLLFSQQSCHSDTKIFI